LSTRNRDEIHRSGSSSKPRSSQLSCRKAKAVRRRQDTLRYSRNYKGTPSVRRRLARPRLRLAAASHQAVGFGPSRDRRRRRHAAPQPCRSVRPKPQPTTARLARPRPTVATPSTCPYLMPSCDPHGRYCCSREQQQRTPNQTGSLFGTAKVERSSGSNSHWRRRCARSRLSDHSMWHHRTCRREEHMVRLSAMRLSAMGTVVLRANLAAVMARVAALMACAACACSHRQQAAQPGSRARAHSRRRPSGRARGH